jgi:hypothetical protein
LIDGIERQSGEVCNNSNPTVCRKVIYLECYRVPQAISSAMKLLPVEHRNRRAEQKKSGTEEGNRNEQVIDEWIAGGFGGDHER